MTDKIEELMDEAAVAVREEILRQYRDDDRGKCPAGSAWFEEHVAPGLIARAAAAALRTQRDEVVEECAALADKRGKAHEASFISAVEFKHDEHQTRFAVAAREAEELATAIRNLKSQDEPR